MPKRIPNMSITMTRGGKRVTLKSNKVVELTAAEIKEIEASGGKGALRNPTNEEVDLPTQVLPAGGITNLDDTAANPQASMPAPLGAATSPTTGSKAAPKPAKPGGKEDPKAGADDL